MQLRKGSIMKHIQPRPGEKNDLELSIQGTLHSGLDYQAKTRTLVFRQVERSGSLFQH